MDLSQDLQPWRKSALCRNLDEKESDEIFFLERGKKSTNAKKFCAPCPVKRECLIFSVIHNETGIWGGYTDAERENMYGFVLNSYGAMVQNSTTTVAMESRHSTDWLPYSVFERKFTTQDQVHQVTGLIDSDYLEPVVQLSVTQVQLVVPVLDLQQLEDAVALAEALLAAL